MAQPAISVRGLKETTRSLEKLGVAATDLKKAMRKTASLVSDDAISGAPTLHGDLAASIRPNNAKNKAVVRAGSARVPYAGVIEYGGYNGIAPRHFLLNAVERKQDEAVRMIDTELRGLIRQYGLN